MTSRPLRRRAVRIAAISMAVVGLLLFVVMTATDLLVARNLTAGVDDRLRDQLNRAAPSVVAVAPAGGGAEQDFSEPVLRWSIAPHGSVIATESGTPPLPATLANLSGYATASIAGTEFRVAGQAQPTGGRVIVAASMSSVSHAMSTLLLTELIVAPLLLASVFAGSFAIGRRVAAPIEAMRQRHLDFTADASHELRTPLSVIQAETSLLSEESSGEARASLERIGGEADRMRRIVEDLLWLARFDTEPAPPHSEPVDLAAVAAVATERFRTVASRRSLTLRLSVPPQESVVVHAVPEWLDRLAGVLVDNACRYSSLGGEVVVEVTSRAGHPRLAVRDSGPGIAAAERQHIFNRFHRGLQEGEGAGLGLAIASAVVSSTEGRWEISNRAEGGAEFAVVWHRRRRGSSAAEGVASAPTDVVIAGPTA
jgi:two-component system, OmpR family, sensor histidine kinase CiaH